MEMFLYGLLGMIVPLLFLAAFIYFILQLAKPNPKETLDVPKFFGWSLLLAVVGFNIFGYDIERGIGIGLFATTIISSIVLTATQKQKTAAMYWFAGVGALAGLAHAGRANEFVQGVNSAVVLICIAALIIMRSTDRIHWHGFWIVRVIVAFCMRCIRHIPIIARSLFSVKDSKHPGALRAIRTLIITAFVLIFFTIILSHADAIFEQLVENVLDQLLGRTLQSILLAAVLSMLLTASMAAPKKDTLKLSFLGFSEVALPLGSLIVLFGVFLFIQAKYLFLQHGQFVEFDITYSDYVRKGFIELLVATSFGGLVAYIASLRERLIENANHRKVIRVLNGFVIVCLGLLLLSAFKRDAMYMEVYGLTRVRIVGTIFLGWLAIVLVGLFVFAVLEKMKEYKLLTVVGLSSVVALATINVVNMDKMIAEATPPRGIETDHLYISMLSADAVEGWHAAIVDATDTYEALLKKHRNGGNLTNAEKKNLAHAHLISHFIGDEYERLHDEDIQTMELHLADDYAVEYMRLNKPAFKAADCLQKNIKRLALSSGSDIFEHEQERLYEYEYPLVHTSMGYYPYYYDYELEIWDGKEPTSCSSRM